MLQQQAEVINIDDEGRQHHDDTLSDDDEVRFPQDYQTEDLYSVYNRLYSHAMYKKRIIAEDQLEARKTQGRQSKTKGEHIGNRLYRQHKDRENRHTAIIIEQEIENENRRSKFKMTKKSNQLVQDKLVRDIERVIDIVDYEGSGYFAIEQIG